MEKQKELCGKIGRALPLKRLVESGRNKWLFQNLNNICLIFQAVQNTGLKNPLTKDSTHWKLQTKKSRNRNSQKDLGIEKKPEIESYISNVHGEILK